MQEQTGVKRASNPNIWTGLLLLLIGGVLLLRQTGFPLPHWLFRWEMILITIGILIGARNRFRDLGWLIMVMIGFVFLSDDIWPEFTLRQYAVPVIIIAIGLIFVFAPRRVCSGRHGGSRHRLRHDENSEAADSPAPSYELSLEAELDIVSIFAGIKKNILSKQFRGGEIVCVFGGAEINLANADFKSPVEIEIVNVFGGTKLVVPANWEIRSEVTAIFGGVDDKRHQPPNLVPEKVIILKGTLLFGGVEVTSF